MFDLSERLDKKIQKKFLIQSNSMGFVSEICWAYKHLLYVDKSQ